MTNDKEIDDHKITKLTDKDEKIVLDALDRPPAPTSELKDILREESDEEMAKKYANYKYEQYETPEPEFQYGWLIKKLRKDFPGNDKIALGIYNLFESYNEREDPDLEVVIDGKTWKGQYYEYMDNYRWCEVGNKEQEKIYKKIEGRGCCGYYDEVHEFDGVKVKIGFNYGH